MCSSTAPRHGRGVISYQKKAELSCKSHTQAFSSQWACMLTRARRVAVQFSLVSQPGELERGCKDMKCHQTQPSWISQGCPSPWVKPVCWNMRGPKSRLTPEWEKVFPALRSLSTSIMMLVSLEAEQANSIMRMPIFQNCYQLGWKAPWLSNVPETCIAPT